MANYDVIVLGAGAMGSAAAYHLARAGVRVLLLEQYEIDHRWGSSWGYTRIIRYSYAEAIYIKLALETYPLWDEVAQEAGERLIYQTGGLDFGRTGEKTLEATIANLAAFKLPHEVLSPEEAQARFPQFRFDAHDQLKILYQPETGIVTPSRSVRAHIRLARQRGVDVRDMTPVEHIEVLNDGVRVHTPSETHSAARLIVCAGAWAGRLLAQEAGLHLPLMPLRVQEAQFSPPSAEYDWQHMPVFIVHEGFDAGTGMYGIPDFEGTGVKAAYHGGRGYAHPSEVPYLPEHDEIVRIRKGISPYVPFLTDAPLLMTRVCLYTMTPDEHFIIDQHPVHPQVIIAGGFSGHGFKFSTGIGKILSDLALEGRTPHDISLFGLGRFGTA